MNKQKYAGAVDMLEVFTSKFERECEMYERTCDPSKTCDRLLWWKNHEHEFPGLVKCAKYVFGIPALRATSERFF